MTADALIPYSVVIPTVGRPSLQVLLDALADCDGPRPEAVVLADDRPDADRTALAIRPGGWVEGRLQVVRTGGRGPAAARNAGWRMVRTPWIAFLDDDVRVSPSWLDDLAADLCAAEREGAVGSQGRIAVPLPGHRRPTDWERGTAGLSRARWITADMAYRRDVLVQVAGFDERFPRAFREDADLALRILTAVEEARSAGSVVEEARSAVSKPPPPIANGARTTNHPARPAPWNASVRAQRGNADDALMRRLHGSDWPVRAGEHVGRRPRHMAAVGAAVLALGSAFSGRRRLATAASLGWVGLLGEFAWARISPGPRDRREVAAMLATSAAIPPVAVWHWLRGTWRHRNATPWPPPIRAVIVDRDGTLVHDVPYNSDPALVDPLPGVEKGLARLREAGLRVGVVSNQSGVGRGLLTLAQVAAVNARVEQLLGRFDTWRICPHGPDEACSCRKPQGTLLRRAAAELGVEPYECAVIGDIGSDMHAAIAAGAQLALLVPTSVTRHDELETGDAVCDDFDAATDLVLERVRP